MVALQCWRLLHCWLQKLCGELQSFDDLERDHYKTLAWHRTISSSSVVRSSFFLFQDRATRGFGGTTSLATRPACTEKPAIVLESAQYLQYLPHDFSM